MITSSSATTSANTLNFLNLFNAISLPSNLVMRSFTLAKDNADATKVNCFQSASVATLAAAS